MNENNKLFFKDSENKISVLDFNFVTHYSIEKVEDNTLQLVVFLTNSTIRIYPINRLIINLPNVSISSGIYYEITGICIHLTKNENAEIPKWMNQQSTY